MARQGVRSAWSDVPLGVRDSVDEMLGSQVVRTTAIRSGFSPGPAVRADLADGRSVFIKAAGTTLNPDSPLMHRREGAVLAQLPTGVPAPRLLGVVDDGDWVALAVEWVDGRMPVASDPTDVRRLLDLLHRLADVKGRSPDDGWGTLATTHEDLFGHWQLLADERDPGLDEWSQRHLGSLAELDQLAIGATEGAQLLHVDVRTDNVLLATTGPTDDLLVDWPGASLGAGWVDLVALLPALHLDGGPPPAEVLASTPLGRSAEPEAVDAFVVALAGYFTRNSLQPAPPGLPTLRPFQAAQGAIARTWAAERLRLE
jgi:aminoglycoside phosphotransferase (APT) family kinase protein